MKRILSVAIISLAGFSASVLATTSYYEAEVLESIPVYRTVEISIPHQECWNEEVVRNERRYNDHRSNTSGLLGAVIGGALGNAVGHNKSNKRIGAVVGALLGNSIARDISSQSNRDSVRRIELVERCETAYDFREEQKLVGYDVLYGYNGQEYSVRMSRDPGASVRIRVNVEPVL